MLKTIIKYGLILVAAILVYNLFFGTAEEKAQSKEVFKQTGKAVGAAWNLLKSEKEKFDAGKYDKVLDQLSGAYRAVREQAKNLDEKVIKRLDNLEQRKSEIKDELNSMQSDSSNQEERREKLQRELDALVKDTESLLNDAQK